MSAASGRDDLILYQTFTIFTDYSPSFTICSPGGAVPALHTVGTDRQLVGGDLAAPKERQPVGEAP